jgi:uncharacterized membrane protein
MTSPISPPLSARQRGIVLSTDRFILAGARHWLLVINFLFGAYSLTPWLAPVLMHTGHARAAGLIYTFYSTQCHQLPERSYFLFGQKASYSLSEVQAAFQNTNNPAILRQFIGNPDMGWKVAWSDRMVSMYTTIFAAGLLFALVRRRLKPLSLVSFGALVLPMIADGGSHALSDLAGIGRGFRDGNAWLAALTGQVFPAWFYAGDTLGSFNSSMRLITGILFGVACVWLAYPYIEQSMSEMRVRLEENSKRAGVVD